jgi:hypothetical protein
MRRIVYGLASLTAAVLAPTGQSAMAAGASGRLAYGLATVFAPRFIAGRFAAPVPESSFMNLRGFGGQHIAIAVFTLFAVRSSHLARPAVLLNVGVETCDAVVGGLELRDRGIRDPIAVGAVTLPFINLAYWLAALRKVEQGLAAEATDVT